MSTPEYDQTRDLPLPLPPSCRCDESGLACSGLTVHLSLFYLAELGSSLCCSVPSVYVYRQSESSSVTGTSQAGLLDGEIQVHLEEIIVI